MLCAAGAEEESGLKLYRSRRSLIVLAGEKQTHSVHVVRAMLFLKHVEDLGAIASHSQTLVSRAEHEVNELLRRAVATGCFSHTPVSRQI